MTTFLLGDPEMLIVEELLEACTKAIFDDGLWLGGGDDMAMKDESEDWELVSEINGEGQLDGSVESATDPRGKESEGTLMVLTVCMYIILSRSAALIEARS